MSTKEISIDIDKNGNISYSLTGFHNHQCSLQEHNLFKMGQVVKVEKNKKEYYAQKNVKVKNQTTLSRNRDFHR